ncbi:MAG: M24 family metallopeptidase [Nitrospirota bacterium]
MKRYDAILIIASSEVDQDLYYAAKFLAPDPFIFIQRKEEKIMVIGDLEIDRAKVIADADIVLSFSGYKERIKKKKGGDISFIDVVDEALTDLEIRHILVPANFPIEYADTLRERRYIIDFKKAPFWEERGVKSRKEIENISDILKITEEALDAGIQKIRDSTIKDGLLYLEGEVLTSEDIKMSMNIILMENAGIARHTIVACGIDCCEPHNQGSGQLHADMPIIIDIFPRSDKHRYFADITRTVVKGRASDELKSIYKTVLAGQEAAFRLIKDGADGKEIHKRILRLFDESGYRTGIVNGRMQGFFHGTGHGIGLDIHEFPRISRSGDILRKGNIVTVEPGLYYPDIRGGVRIEDMVIVTDDGCINMTRYPKILEI